MTVVPQVPEVDVPNHVDAVNELLMLREEAQRLTTGINAAQQRIQEMQVRALILQGAIAAYEQVESPAALSEDQSAE